MQTLWASLQPHLTLWANGLLAVAYWTWDQAALLIALACGLVVLVRHDRAVQRTAGDRLRRYDRGVRVQASYRAQLETAVTLLVWLIAAALSASPIPAIGAGMWLALLAAVALLPQEREGVLFRHKGMLALYGLMAIGLRLVLAYVPDLGQMGLMLNGRGEAAALFDSVRDGVLPYVMLFMWLVYPGGYLSLIAQRFAVNRGSLLQPGGTPEAWVRTLRGRGEG